MGVKLNRKGRECTFVNKTPFFKFKDNNIKLYKASLFSKTSSSKLKIKINTNVNQDKENQKSKDKKRRANHRESQNSLKIHLNIELNDTPKEKEKKNKISPKLDNQIKPHNLNQNQENELILDIRTSKRAKSKSFMIKRFKKLKTFNKELDPNDAKKLQTTYKKKFSETRKNLDFESALKNAKNLGNTQYNLLSPDKFTNTEFCDSDYCEYTLECMDLILNQNRSQKLVKSKVNFNFPKNQKNKTKKKIALFDLDETLVHCTGDITLNKEPYQHCIEIILPGNKEVKVGINIRPHWKKTLKLIRKNYHIVVFTASHQAYADAVLDFMDPNKKYFKYRLYRNNCSLVDVDGSKFYVKDLDIFDESYDLKDIVIIDNSVLSFIYHLENGIPIVPYYKEDKDSSLYVVGLYLMHIYKENDLRKANKKYINLDSFLNEARIKKNINDEQNIINEESISVENNNENINKIESNKEIVVNSNNNGSNKDSKQNIKRCSDKTEKACPIKLMSQSKLINMYYEINDKSSLSPTNVKDIIKEKSNRNSFSSEDEKIIKDYKTDDDVIFHKNRLIENKPEIIKNKFKSTRICHNYLDLNVIKSNFYNNFSEEHSLIK